MISLKLKDLITITNRARSANSAVSDVGRRIQIEISVFVPRIDAHHK